MSRLPANHAVAARMLQRVHPSALAKERRERSNRSMAPAFVRLVSEFA